MIRYKDTLVGKGSALAEALEKSPEAAKKVYDDTTRRYEAMHSQEDRKWFSIKSKG